MTLRDDLTRLARDYGIPGGMLVRIDADRDGATFEWWENAPLALIRNSRTVPLSACPSLPDAGTPIYDSLIKEDR